MAGLISFLFIVAVLVSGNLGLAVRAAADAGQ